MFSKDAPMAYTLLPLASEEEGNGDTTQISSDSAAGVE